MASLGIVYAVLGFGCLHLMKYTGDMLDAVFVRLGALLFVAAGFVFADGLIGRLVRAGTVTVTSTGAQVARSVSVSTVIWMFWFGAGVLWLLCLLPEKWFGEPMPDWLSMAGLVLPVGLASVPGPAGAALTGLMRAGADLVSTPVRALFGG